MARARAPIARWTARDVWPIPEDEIVAFLVSAVTHTPREGKKRPAPLSDAWNHLMLALQRVLRARCIPDQAPSSEEGLLPKLAKAFAAEPARGELLTVIEAMVEHAKKGPTATTSPFASAKIHVDDGGEPRFTGGLGELVAYAFLLAGLGERGRADAVADAAVDAIRDAFEALRTQKLSDFDPQMRGAVKMAIEADRASSKASCEFVEQRKVLDAAGFHDAQVRLDAGWRGWMEGRA